MAGGSKRPAGKNSLKNTQNITREFKNTNIRTHADIGTEAEVNIINI